MLLSKKRGGKSEIRISLEHVFLKDFRQKQEVRLKIGIPALFFLFLSKLMESTFEQKTFPPLYKHKKTFLLLVFQMPFSC
jgi:hypothetical protein